MPDFLRLLRDNHVVLLDGAMGTELDKTVFDMEVGQAPPYGDQ